MNNQKLKLFILYLFLSSLVDSLHGHYIDEDDYDVVGFELIFSVKIYIHLYFYIQCIGVYKSTLIHILMLIYSY